MIKEPTLEFYACYLRRVEGDTDKVTQERRDVFRQEFEALLTHVKRLSGQAIPEPKWLPEDQGRRASQLILSGRLGSTATRGSHSQQHRPLHLLNQIVDEESVIRDLEHCL